MFYPCDSTKTWHVSKLGSDANPGHAQQYPINLAADAKRSINAALNLAAGGDTIVIWPGTYVESVDLKSLGKALTLVGTSKHHCIINYAAGSNVVLETGCGLYNLTCIGSAYYEYPGLLAQNISDIVIENCRLMAGGFVSGTVAAYFYSLKNARIKDTIFEGLSEGLVLLGSSRNLIFENCVFNVETESLSVNPAAALNVTSSEVSAVFTTCTFNADRLHNDYPTYAADVKGNCVFKNCAFSAVSSTAAAVAALKTQGSAFNNCGFKSQAAPQADCFDIQAYQIPAVVTASRFDPGKVSGDINIDPRLHCGQLNSAVKMLVNKAVQSKTTNAVTYFDDDGQTALFTHTPVETENQITREPS